eukprot:bmy_09480T0
MRRERMNGRFCFFSECGSMEELMFGDILKKYSFTYVYAHVFICICVCRHTKIHAYTH